MLHSLPCLVTTDFAFQPQAPSGSLSAGVPATVTLHPVPPGVNSPTADRSDTKHYLWVSGGGGDGEAVLVTGGTAVSGAGSGTVVFTPTRSRANGYTIESATAGIQEAVSAAANGDSVYIPPGSHVVRAPITVPYRFSPPSYYAKTIELFGGGVYVSKVLRAFAVGDLLHYPPAQAGHAFHGVVNIHDLDLGVEVGGTATSGAQLRCDGYLTGTVRSLFVHAGGNDTLFDGIVADSPNRVVFSGITISDFTRAGLRILTTYSVAQGIYDSLFLNASGNVARCVSLEGTGHNFTGPIFSNITTQLGAYGFHMDPGANHINEGRISNAILDSHRACGIAMVGSDPAGSGGYWGVDNVLCGCPSGASLRINERWTAIQFSNCNMGSGDLAAHPPEPNVVLAGCRNVQFSNCILAGCTTDDPANVAVQFEASGGVAPSRITFTGCHIGLDQNGNTGTAANAVNVANFAMAGKPGDNISALAVSDCVLYGRTEALGFSRVGPNSAILLRENRALPAGGTTKPAASGIFRGSTWYTEAAPGTADAYEVCRKDAGGSYAWVALF